MGFIRSQQTSRVCHCKENGETCQTAEGKVIESEVKQGLLWNIIY